MIYDCFPFFNELELLEIRLHELSDVVDYFVLVEATRTFTGLLKPLYFCENSHLFSEFMSKIIWVIVEDMPISRASLDFTSIFTDGNWAVGDIVGDNWTRERYQRDKMMGVLKHCDPNDIIILGDADEIMRASVVKELENTLCEGLSAVEQFLNSYYLNLTCTNMPWHGTKIFRKKYMTTLSQDRFHTEPSCIIENGGWHYNFFGGAERIQLKVQSYAHQECNTPDVINLENINRRLKNKLDVLGRLYEYEKVEMTKENTPEYVINNLDKFDHLIYHD